MHIRDAICDPAGDLLSACERQDRQRARPEAGQRIAGPLEQALAVEHRQVRHDRHMRDAASGACQRFARALARFLHAFAGLLGKLAHLARQAVAPRAAALDHLPAEDRSNYRQNAAKDRQAGLRVGGEPGHRRDAHLRVIALDAVVAAQVFV